MKKVLAVLLAVCMLASMLTVGMMTGLFASAASETPGAQRQMKITTYTQFYQKYIKDNLKDGVPQLVKVGDEDGVPVYHDADLALQGTIYDPWGRSWETDPNEQSHRKLAKGEYITFKLEVDANATELYINNMYFAGVTCNFFGVQLSADGLNWKSIGDYGDNSTALESGWKWDVMDVSWGRDQNNRDVMAAAPVVDGKKVVYLRLVSNWNNGEKDGSASKPYTGNPGQLVYNNFYLDALVDGAVVRQMKVETYTQYWMHYGDAEYGMEGDVPVYSEAYLALQGITYDVWGRSWETDPHEQTFRKLTNGEYITYKLAVDPAATYLETTGFYTFGTSSNWLCIQMSADGLNWKSIGDYGQTPTEYGGAGPLETGWDIYDLDRTYGRDTNNSDILQQCQIVDGKKIVYIRLIAEWNQGENDGSADKPYVKDGGAWGSGPFTFNNFYIDAIVPTVEPGESDTSDIPEEEDTSDIPEEEEDINQDLVYESYRANTDNREDYGANDATDPGYFHHNLVSEKSSYYGLFWMVKVNEEKGNLVFKYDLNDKTVTFTPWLRVEGDKTAKINVKASKDGETWVTLVNAAEVAHGNKYGETAEWPNFDKSAMNDLLADNPEKIVYLNFEYAGAGSTGDAELQLQGFGIDAGADIRVTTKGTETFMGETNNRSGASEDASGWDANPDKENYFNKYLVADASKYAGLNWMIKVGGSWRTQEDCVVFKYDLNDATDAFYPYLLAQGDCNTVISVDASKDGQTWVNVAKDEAVVAGDRVGDTATVTYHPDMTQKGDGVSKAWTNFNTENMKSVLEDNPEKIVYLKFYNTGATDSESQLQAFGISSSYSITQMKEIASATITGEYKTQYMEGEVLDINGMNLHIVYTDGSEEDVKVGHNMVSGFDSNTLGEQTLTVKYANATATVTLNVVEFVGEKTEQFYYQMDGLFGFEIFEGEDLANREKQFEETTFTWESVLEKRPNSLKISEYAKDHLLAYSMFPFAGSGNIDEPYLNIEGDGWVTLEVDLNDRAVSFYFSGWSEFASCNFYASKDGGETWYLVADIGEKATGLGGSVVDAVQSPELCAANIEKVLTGNPEKKFLLKINPSTYGKALICNLAVNTVYNVGDVEDLPLVDETLEAEKAAGAAVDALILAIGDVEYTDESKALIDAARAAYDALSDAEKPHVKELWTLEDAEETYESLAKKAANQAKADEVMALIDAIGEVDYTIECKEAIIAALDAYDALTGGQKQLVENKAVLDAAQLKFNELADAAGGAEPGHRPDAPESSEPDAPESSEPEAPESSKPSEDEGTENPGTGVAIPAAMIGLAVISAGAVLTLKKRR